MIRIITSKTLAALRAESALVPGLRHAAEQSDRKRQESEAARLAADAARDAAEDALAAARKSIGPLSPQPPSTRAAESGARHPEPGPAACLSRREVVRGHLNRILATPAPANHADHRCDPHRDHSAASRQLAQVRILQMLFGPDEVAAVYQQWLDVALREQEKTAEPLRSWDEIAIDSAPVGWPQRDVHGFLCACCTECFWQVITVGDILERLCGRCARRELDMEPGQVWAPRLPPADAHIAYPGLLPGERRENTIEASLTDGSTRRYGLGDARAFLASRNWMDLDARGTLSGLADQPRMEVTGSTSAEGHQFAFIVTLDFDPTPQGTRQAPYGFRYTSGTLTSHGETCAIADPFDLLDTIARGEAEFTTAPAPV
jgi:hypothetical protein